MNIYLLLLVECVTSLTISLIVLNVLSRPMTHVLERICPDEQAAAFWISYTKVMLTIAPLVLVLFASLIFRFNDPLDTLRVNLMAALGGVLLGLHIIGKCLGQFVNPPAQAKGAP